MTRRSAAAGVSLILASLIASQSAADGPRENVGNQTVFFLDGRTVTQTVLFGNMDPVADS